MDKAVSIRRVKAGDENSLAYVQTESWKEAFREIVSADILSQCTEIERAAEMYKMLLAENKGNGYILELDGRPHCIAWWDAAREENMRGFAELICIHSLRDNWHKGYGKMMMERVLDDVRRAGYSKLMLWVFDSNVAAQSGFYEANGFAASGKKAASLAPRIIQEINLPSLHFLIYISSTHPGSPFFSFTIHSFIKSDPRAHSSNTQSMSFEYPARLTIIQHPLHQSFFVALYASYPWSK